MLGATCRFLDVLGNHLPIPGAGIVMGLMSWGIKQVADRESSQHVMAKDRKEQALTQPAISTPGDMETVAKKLAVLLITQYKEPIRRLDVASARALGKSVLPHAMRMRRRSCILARAPKLPSRVCCRR